MTSSEDVEVVGAVSKSSDSAAVAMSRWTNSANDFLNFLKSAALDMMG